MENALLLRQDCQHNVSSYAFRRVANPKTVPWRIMVENAATEIRE
jgi:hypothetical protein